ncbi:MAG: hypothetical protein WCF40_01725 [Desulfobacterales bacterium]|jgi:opacity protein-like surface antigen
MKRNMLLFVLVLVAAVGLASAATAAEVSQGKVVQITKDPAKVTIEEYDTNFSTAAPYGQSTGITTVFDLSTAQVGIPPEPGDVLRIAYVIEGSTNKALKVMNVSKQDLRKK